MTPTVGGLRLPRAPFHVDRASLSNGLRLVTIEAPHLHTASVALYVRAGSRYETKTTSGLSHFVEHMLFRGSERFPSSFALNLAIERLGGTLYAETGRDYSLFQISLHPREVPAGLAILGDLFARPTFSDIDLERQIVLEEILDDLDEEGRNVNVDDVSRATVWHRQPLGMPITGPMRNVRGFTRDDVRRHFRRLYGASNMVLAVSGPVNARAVRHAVAGTFADVPRGRRAVARSAEISLGGPRFRSVRNDSPQTQVHLLLHAIPERDADYVALAALMRILDDGMSTRLHYRICDQKGLAYHASGSIEPLHDATLIEIDAACGHAKLPALVTEALAILSELRDGEVQDAELVKAKHRYRRDLEASYDDLEGLCGWFGGTELFYRARSHEERARLMDRVTLADVRRVAGRVIRRERLTVVAVGDHGRAIAERVRKIVRAWR